MVIKIIIQELNIESRQNNWFVCISTGQRGLLVDYLGDNIIGYHLFNDCTPHFVCTYCKTCLKRNLGMADSCLERNVAHEKMYIQTKTHLLAVTCVSRTIIFVSCDSA